MIPGLLFIPGLNRVRILTRIAVYLVPMLAWVFLGSTGKSGYFGSSRAGRWLVAALGWMVLMIAHPGTDLVSGIAQIFLTFSIVCPAFWVEKAINDPRRVSRCLAILLICSTLSALVGLGQVLRPNLIPNLETSVLSSEFLEELKIEVNGHRVLRPTGLTDTPGGACLGGLMAAILGVAWILRPISRWKKIFCAGCSFIGLSVIYFSQVRIMLLTWIGMTFVLMGLLFLQRDFKRLALLALSAGAIFAGSFVWVVATGGDAIMGRFSKLTEENAVDVYQTNRGGFVQSTFTYYLPGGPLGYGLGRYGMMATYFGDASLPYRNQQDGGIWVEVQLTAWVIDGGAPLLVINLVAIGLSFWTLYLIVKKTRRHNQELANWAAVVFAMNAGIFVQCFGSCPFLGPIGIEFWIFASMIRGSARLNPALRAVIL
ncbi:MAG: hypothetical protein NVSMB14_06240 [Isosphaeraceae bacterium]